MTDCDHHWVPKGVGRRCTLCHIEEYLITDEQMRTALALKTDQELIQTVRPLPWRGSTLPKTDHWPAGEKLGKADLEPWQRDTLARSIERDVAGRFVARRMVIRTPRRH